MSQRIAVAVALIVFAVCVLAGMEAGNTFSTTVTRALKAMAATLAIGMIVGVMAQKMLDENLRQREKNLEIPEAKPEDEGR